MFKTLKNIFSPKNSDIRKRILFTLGALLIFKVGTLVKVPGTEVISGDLGFLELMDVMGGGALKQFSIFALGVMPYITASIIMQLLQMDIIPYFSELKQQGQAGRNKINMISRYVGIAFAFIQGYMMSFAFIGSDAGALEYLRIALILAAGTAFLLWLGDQITTKGIGNGISLIIMAGIISTMPQMFADAYGQLVTANTGSLFIGIISFAVFVIIYIAIVIGVIYVQTAERRLPIQYSNKTSTAYGAKQNYMPIKINSAGVIPVIFASTIVIVPSTIAGFINNESFTLFTQKYLTYDSPIGFGLYVLFIIFFAYFYTFMQLNPKDLSDNLTKSGGYIPGVRPGKQTIDYIKQVLSRLTIVGALFLVVIAALPILFSNMTSLPSSVKIGGTGLLIVVGVALESYKQLESSLVSRNYKGGRTRR